MTTMDDLAVGTISAEHAGKAVEGLGTRVLKKAEQSKVEKANALVREAYDLLNEVFSDPMPVGRVQWIHIDRVQANDYNPNAVAGQEMKLLHTSISEDGYTQPVVSVIEPRCDILLPCSHKSSVPLNVAEYLMKPLWGTPQGSLTGKAVSVRLASIDEAGGGSRSVSPKATTEKNSVSGSRTRGAGSGASTVSKDSVSHMSGTLHESETSSTFLAYACPTCESSDRRHKKSWSSSALLIPGTAEALGLKVSWLSSETTTSSRPKNSPESFDAATMLSGSSDENWDWVPLDTVIALPDSVAVIVDGFHRYTTMRRYADIYDATGGHLPVVVLDKSIADRIASTVRHNRARGKHSVQGMGTLVFNMLREGETDETICNKLGLEAEELARLKHITGYSKLYADIDYSPLVLTKTQVEEKALYKKEHPDEEVPQF